MKSGDKLFGLIVLSIILIGLTGCTIRTPEIRGVVLDEETKQPVEKAWVTATLGIKTKTVGGDVHSYLSVDEPHTRTDNVGKFTIPSRKFRKPTIPVGFGTEVENFGVSASTADDRGGSVSLKESVGKGRLEVTIYIKPEFTNSTEGEYFTYLQGLYNYCLTGRFYVEVPPVESGCDEWELNYVITKHERYLKRFPKTDETRSHYGIIFEQLGHLYEKIGEYEKAIENFKKARERRFFRPQDLDLEIEKLQKLIKSKIKD